MNKLDMTSRKILFELDRNARQSNTQIAKKIGVSKDIVNYRINKLEEDNTIQFYTAIIDTSRLGYQSVRVVLCLIDIDVDTEKELISFLVKKEEVFFVTQFRGTSDITFGFASKNPSELQKFSLELKSKFSRYIENFEFAFYDELYHLHRKYLLSGGTSKMELMGVKEVENYDDLDIKILKLLTSNARINIVELAEKLKKPATTLVSRIKSLEEKKIILGYTVILSAKNLGLEYYKVELKLNDFSESKKLLELCSQHPNIIYFMRSVGSFDAEFYLEIESVSTLLSVITGIRHKLKGIRNWQYSASMIYHKFRYF